MPALVPRLNPFEEYPPPDLSPDIYDVSELTPDDPAVNPEDADDGEIADRLPDGEDVPYNAKGFVEPTDAEKSNIGGE